MQNHLIELRVGEALQVGQYTVRLLEVDGDELCLEIDSGESWQQAEYSFGGRLRELVCASAN